MESPPIQLSTVFTDDFRFFEANHGQYPCDAAAVFGCVADLRAALQSFRETTQCSGERPRGGEEEEECADCGTTEPALLPAGSTDEEDSDKLA